MGLGLKILSMTTRQAPVMAHCESFGEYDPYEDDMVRLLFGHQRDWEYLAGYNWQCGQEGNGVIIGRINSVYAESFCTEDNPNDACSVSMASVYSGPNRLGDRYSDIGQPRNAYASQNTFNCNAYDSADSDL